MSDDEYSSPEQCYNIADYKKQRASIKGRLTLFEKYVSKFESAGTLTLKQRAEFELRMNSISNLLKSFNTIQQKVEHLSDDTESKSHLEYRESFEDQYFSVLSTAKCLLNGVDKRDSASGSGFNCQVNKAVTMKLPQIRLPSFDGSYDHWLEFKNSYISMIHERTDLDSIQKFHYLKCSLSGSALQVISALEFTAANYTHAWELLENRYHNNRLLIHNHVKSLFAAQAINKESPLLIRKLIDTVLRNLRALKSLGEPTDGWDTLINHIIVSKLDSSTDREWENHKGSVLTDSQNTPIKLDYLLSFLRNRADMLDMIQDKHSRPNQNNNNYKPSVPTYRKPNNNTQQSHSLVSTRNNSGNKSSVRLCVMCGANHPLYTCIQFLNLSVKDRVRIVEDSKLCKNCLRSGHNISECVYGPCKRCEVKHNSLLHFDCNNSEAAQAAPAAAASHATADPKPVSIASCALNSLHVNNNESLVQLPQVLLSTALVEVMDSDNQYHTARALLDSGSQNCFITEKLSKRLNISVIQSTIHISGVGHSVSQSNQLCEIDMRSKTNNYCTRLRCFVLPSITTSLPVSSVDYDTMIIPNNVSLADPSFDVPSKVDLLIGADVFWDLLEEDRIRLSNGPYLQNSKLGWFISGPVYNSKHHVNKSVHCNFVQSSATDAQLRQFWELEEVERPNSLLTEDERKCEEHFTKTTTRDHEGRFSVRIPLKESADVLGDSYDLAKTRFLSLERKLDRLPSYKQIYSDFMREYNDLGHMTLIDDNNSKPCYYLPHHGVFREHSTTTKLRVVFDASAVTTSNKSLNDIQLVGPPLQNDIFSILLRFRQHRYVACADVEKMFRQALIQHDQRRLQLILWREDSSQPLSTYQLNTITYGTASAPYLSMRCLRQLALETSDDVIADVINNDFFVDDLITGHDDPSILSSICDKVSKVLNSGCFPLRKWTFSHDLNTTTSKELSTGDHCQNKTLGLGWQVDSDELHFTSNVNHKPPVTKRTVMSVISQIYDPLGLLAPMIIIAKIMLQKLWLVKIDWDETVPTDVSDNWNRFIEGLSHLSSLRVPRYVMREGANYRELHVFTDASQDAYGACAYVRSWRDCASVAVNLLCAKSKVAPVKTVCTIPRLELCGALLGARLYRKIVKSLKVIFDKIVFWTDSTIVMGWLRMSPHSLKTFVQNRVSEINEITGDALWVHINGKNNPADIVSRGLYLNELKENDKWWHGPQFLQERELTYSSGFNSDLMQTLPEVRAQIVSTILCTKQEDIIDIERFSSFNRLRRAAAYILRFIGNIRPRNQQRKTGPLSVDELNAATILLARLAQSHSFPDEHKRLVKNLGIKSKRIIGLNVFLDKNNLLRVGGRIQNSPVFSDNKKHPVLLCSKHRFTILLFRQEHEQLFHAGPQLLLSSLREAWWPLGGRDLARKTVHACVKCTRLRGKTLNPIMGNLPVQRLEAGFPFMRCGVDYAGPVMILSRKGRGATLKKGYICLFICLSTRSVHLELASSLSTDDYILALKRFISRRGKPAEILSDNGRNFVGAEKELLTIFNKNDNSDIINYAVNNSIKFTFIPPYCPHFGGMWEAGVKSCKYHLRRVVGLTNLTYEEFSTVLAQTEAILNSRPLSALSTDPNDLTPLTPAHFLIGRPLTAPACRDVTAVPNHRLLRYGLIEKMRQDLWRRWSKEYVAELQTRTKWHINKGNVQLNTLALIKDDNMHPLNWRLGRIVQVYPGPDGVSRVADLRTATGIVRRGLCKICPLPVELRDPEDNTSSCSCLGTC